MYARDSWNWVTILPQLVAAYNSNWHSTLKMAPNDVTYKNERKVYESRFSKTPLKKAKFKYKVGQIVRVVQLFNIFRKRFKQTFSDQVYKVIQAIPSDPVVYRIANLDKDEALPGVYYQQELGSGEGDQYVIEKILKTEKKRGKTRYLVEFKGYKGKKYWIDAKDLDA
jgi:hypothetical protein